MDIQYQPSCRASEMQKQVSAVTQRGVQADVNLSIQWNRWLLKPIGVWPNSHDSRLGKCLSWLIVISCYGLISFLSVSCSMFLVYEIEDTYTQIKMIGPISFFVMTILKYYQLVIHEDNIRQCIEYIEWDWKNIGHGEDRDVMVVYANYGRRLVMICTFFMYSSFVFFYIFVPISVGKVATGVGNLTSIQMPFPFSKRIADVRYSPANEIFFCVQFVTGIVIHCITSAACSLGVVFATHACGQMQVLMGWLEYMIDGRPDMNKTVDGRVARIVVQHDRVLKFLALTEKVFQQIAFVEFVGCTLNLCLLEYYIITEWNLKEKIVAFTYVMLLMSFTFNIFMFCYIGELVVNQCQKIGEVTYMIEWYRLSGKKKLCCILIIAMSNSSIKFTAGNMVELSINTFSDVVKTSMAFLNMLRALT